MKQVPSSGGHGRMKTERKKAGKKKKKKKKKRERLGG